MNASDSHADLRADDALLDAAAAFDERLRTGTAASDEFADEHQDLAKVFRLLHTVFRGPATPAADEAGDVGEAPRLPPAMDRFRLMGLLGRGGFGAVYRARDELLHRDVAIKIIPHADDSRDDVDRRLGEARAAARLSHPHVVPLYEAFDDGSACFLVTEYCAGPTLAAWLHEHPGPIAPPLAADVALHLAEATAHAHRRGIVHRDIKPGNVLLARSEDRDGLWDYCPRLTDFGLMGDLHDAAAAAGTEWAGTLAYMPPERLRGSEQAAAPASDVYALGVLIYRLLTGSEPYAADNPVELVRAICVAEPTDVRAHAPAVDRDLAAICSKCLAKEPAKRYVDAEALVDDLRRWKLGYGVQARRRSPLEMAWSAARRAPLAVALAAIAAIAVAGAALTLAVSNRRLVTQEGRLRAATSTAETNAAAARAAEQLAATQRDEARSQRQRALATAYRADLPRLYAALADRDFVGAAKALDAVRAYATGNLATGVELRLADALLSRGFRRLPPHVDRITAIVSLADGAKVAAADRSGTLRLVDLATATVNLERQRKDGREITALAAAPQGDLLAVGLRKVAPLEDAPQRIDVELIDLATGDVRRTFADLPTTVQSLAFTPDGARLAIGCRYQPVTIHALATQEEPVFLDSDRRNREVLFVNDGREAILYARDRTIRRYDAGTGSVLEELPLPDYVRRLAVSSDGRWLAVAMGGIAIYATDDLAAPRGYLRLNPLVGIEELAFAPSGETLAFGRSNGEIGFVDLAAFSSHSTAADAGPYELLIARQAKVHVGAVTALAMTPEGVALSGGDEGALQATDAVTARDDQRTESDALEPSVAWSAARWAADSAQIYLGAVDGSLWQLDAETGAWRRLEGPQNSRLLRIAVSANGVWLASGWMDGAVALYRASDGAVVRRQTPADLAADAEAELYVQALQFSPDGRYLGMLRGTDLLEVWDCGGGAAADSRPTEPGDEPRPATTLWTHRCQRVANAFCFGPRPPEVLYGGLAEEVRWASPEREAERRGWEGPGELIALAYNARRHTYVCQSRNAGLQLRSPAGELLAHQPSPAGSAAELLDPNFDPCLSLSADGRIVVTGTQDGSIRLWDGQDLHPLGLIRAANDAGRRPLAEVEFAADDRKLLWLLADATYQFPESARWGPWSQSSAPGSETPRAALTLVTLPPPSASGGVQDAPGPERSE